MRTTRFFLATVKETPSDAEIISHQLMIRAGMMRRVAAGIYNWLPLGLRVLRKVETIVREEMDRAGALELLMPGVQPAELWQESGRWEAYGPELLRIKDRHQRDFCLGPTHEEVITDIVRTELRSYRQLPLNMYQIQWKFRDEIRPRFGVMRGREFLMKDAYSFDASEEAMRESYEVMRQAYVRIFDRLQLDASAVAADSGAIGGSHSHEFHVLADTGEDAIGICTQCGFAANVEALETTSTPLTRTASTNAMQTVDTPGVHTIADLCKSVSVQPEQTIKTLLVRGETGLVALLLRGDHELNSIKAEKIDAVATPLQFASAAEIKELTGTEPGSIGPVGLDIPIIADHAALACADFICGANKDDSHLTHVNFERDLPDPQAADLRMVTDGEACQRTTDSGDCSGTIQIRRGIEVGHIFQLGTKYSDAMKASVLDEGGKPVNMYMGCYGIGVSRIVAAAIEQNHDDNGVIWPTAIAPFQVCIVPIGMNKSDKVREQVETLYTKLTEAGIDVLLDDRNERPGVMFANMDLIGVPHRLVVGERGLDAGIVEYQPRAAGSDKQELPLDSAVDQVLKLVKN